MKNYLKKLVSQFLKESDIELDIDKDYIITEDYCKDNYSIYDIEMNTASFSIIYDSLIATHPNSAYIVSLINFFQTLTITSEDLPTKYSSYSHSITTFYLKLLAKRGIIKIDKIECKKENFDTDLTSFYDALGNKYRERPTKMYTLIFQKLRDLNMQDIELIRRVQRVFDIPDDEISLKSNDDKLFAQISEQAAFKNIISGRFFIKLCKAITTFKEEYISLDDCEQIKKLIFKKGKKSN